MNYFCPNCSKGFQDFVKLDNHIVKNNCAMKYKCNDCDNYFVSIVAKLEHDCRYDINEL